MPRFWFIAPLVLALILAPPLASLGTAEAGVIVRLRQKPEIVSFSRIVVVVDGDAKATAVNARVESDAGGEDVKLGNAGPLMHGAATIAMLPATDARITLTLQDRAGASLTSFSGTLGADGSLTLTADRTGGDACASKTGCEAIPATTAPDIQLRAAKFSVSTRNDVTFQLTGADLYEIASTEVSIVESHEVTTCATKPERRCTKTGSTTTTAAEVVWDEIGVAWEGDLTLEHHGVVETKVTAYDAKGKKLETAKSRLGAPWLDGGEGVNALAIDKDPLTTLGLFRAAPRSATTPHLEVTKNAARLAIVSQGWAAGAALPTHAEVKLTDGETITMPANSYQRRINDVVRFLDRVSEPLVQTHRIKVDGGNVLFEDLSLADLSSPVCSEGFCVVVTQTQDGGYDLGLTAYGANAADLPNKLELEHTVFDKQGKELTSDRVDVKFDDEIAVVFASEVTFSEDPIGLALSGEVSLLGAPNKKNKRKTLALGKGRFFGIFSRDGDGDLELAGADKDSTQRQTVLTAAATKLETEIPAVVCYRFGELRAVTIEPSFTQMIRD